MKKLRFFIGLIILLNLSSCFLDIYSPQYFPTGKWISEDGSLVYNDGIAQFITEDEVIEGWWGIVANSNRLCFTLVTENGELTGDDIMNITITSMTEDRMVFKVNYNKVSNVKRYVMIKQPDDDLSATVESSP